MMAGDAPCMRLNGEKGLPCLAMRFGIASVGDDAVSSKIGDVTNTGFCLDA